MSIGLIERLVGRIQEHVGAEAPRRDIASVPKVTRRILYIQFTDPAVYPPLEHSSRLLADRGWEVLILGTGTRDELASSIAHSSWHSRQKISICPRRMETKGAIHIVLLCDTILDMVVET